MRIKSRWIRLCNYLQLSQKQKWEKWLIVVLLIWIVSTISIYLWTIDPYTDNNTRNLYLLSALAQSLAAVFAIVFSISLIFAQLISVHSHHIIPRVFDNYVIVYICIFILAIVFAILAINIPNPFIVQTSIVLGLLSFYLLLPYFLRLIELMKPSYLIEQLIKKAENKIIKDPDSETQEITILDNFIMSSWGRKDYDTLLLSVDSLTKLIIRLIKSESQIENYPLRAKILSLISSIADIGPSLLNDPRARLTVMNALDKIAREDSTDLYSMEACNGLRIMGEKAAQDKIYEILKNNFSETIISKLFFIGQGAIRNKLEHTTISSGFGLADIAIKSAKQNDEITKFAVSFLRINIEDAINHNFILTPSNTNIGSSLTYQLGRIGVETIKNKRIDSTRSIITDLNILVTEAISKNSQEVTEEAANALVSMGFEECDNESNVALELITRSLHDIGRKSISASYQQTTKTVVTGLHNIAIETYKGNSPQLASIIKRAVKSLVDLGLYSVLQNKKDLTNIIAKNLYDLNQNAVPYLDVYVANLRIKHDGHTDYLTAITELQNKYTNFTS